MIDTTYGGPYIEPTKRNAESIQRLTLDDLLRGDFPNPHAHADPGNTTLVNRQLDRLQKYPDQYKGHFIDGELVAYLKAAEWTVDNEIPFATQPAKMGLQAMKALHLHHLPRQEYAIYGLVVDNELSLDEQHYITRHFVADALLTAFHQNWRMPVNIVHHDNDPIESVTAGEFHFKQVGPRAEVIGLPGRDQRRFQVRADRGLGVDVDIFQRVA